MQVPQTSWSAIFGQILTAITVLVLLCSVSQSTVVSSSRVVWRVCFSGDNNFHIGTSNCGGCSTGAMHKVSSVKNSPHLCSATAQLLCNVRIGFGLGYGIERRSGEIAPTAGGSIASQVQHRMPRSPT